VRAKPRTTPVSAQKRVAIYTRKSTEEGLEQQFNTLHAQREAVESYIKSQQGQGWVELPDRYDDGGYTGANTDRPAFQRLMKDIEAGKIDIVAVYKIDRLSRSISDFVNTTDVFQAHGVGFVSITQSFDTSNSSGRLMLNILVSFGVYERELIGERTRDKMAASRRRGMWTGGQPILGYDLINKKLVVNDVEAARVVEIYELYRSLGSLMATVGELNARGWKTKAWTSRKGKVSHGERFTKASLHRVLTNVLYTGLMPYRDEYHKGEHAAIVSKDLFDAVADQMHTHGRTGGAALKNKNGALLKGILFCGACGSAMMFHYTQKRERRYGFYVCEKAAKQGARACPGSRAPAGQLEAFVVERVRAVGTDPALIEAAVAAAQLEQEARIPELAEAIREHETEERRLAVEHEQLTLSIERGVTALGGRLGEVDCLLHDARTRATAAREELVALETRGCDEAALRKALDEFDPVWNELFPKEKARILRLLIERVVFDGRASDLEIQFRVGASAALERSA